MDQLAVDKNIHMMAQGSLVIHNITCQAGELTIKLIHKIGNRPGRDLMRLEVREESLQVFGELYDWHDLKEKAEGTTPGEGVGGGGDSPRPEKICSSSVLE